MWALLTDYKKVIVTLPPPLLPFSPPFFSVDTSQS